MVPNCIATSPLTKNKFKLLKCLKCHFLLNYILLAVMNHLPRQQYGVTYGLVGHANIFVVRYARNFNMYYRFELPQLLAPLPESRSLPSV
jgi:hypothetical protein